MKKTKKNSLGKLHKNHSGGFVVLALAIALSGLGTYFLGSIQVAAAGSATLTLTPASATENTGGTFTEDVYENSGSVGVNAVEANVIFNVTAFQYISSADGSSAGSPFTMCPKSSGLNAAGNEVMIGCAITSTNTTGSQIVAQITFKVLGVPGQTNLVFDNGSNNPSNAGGSGSIYASNITEQSNEANIWNEVTTGASRTIAIAPTSSGSSSSSGSSNSSTSGSSGSSTSKTKSSSSSTKTPTPAPTPTPQTTVTAPTVSNSNGSTSAPSIAKFVSIKVVNNDNAPVPNTSVTIDNQTAKTNSSGIASFTNIPVADYQVALQHGTSKATKNISVSASLSSKPEQRQLTLAVNLTSNNWVIYVFIGAVIVLFLIGSLFGFGFRASKYIKHQHTHPGVAAVGNNATPAEQPQTPSPTEPADPTPTSNVAAPTEQPQPSLVKPADPAPTPPVSSPNSDQQLQPEQVIHPTIVSGSNVPLQAPTDPTSNLPS
jgi:hypothetical protein